VKPALLLAAISAMLLSLPLEDVVAKDATIGVYAIVDKLTFEPDAVSAKFVRISGVFVVPLVMSSGGYRKPRRGYIYCRVALGRESSTRAEWNELKTLAGSGKVVGFGQYWVANPHDPYGNPHTSLAVAVHADGDVRASEAYPLPRLEGVTEVHDGDNNKGYDPDSQKIAAQLRAAYRQSEERASKTTPSSSLR
jgi:hypothetical protein